MCDNLSLGVFFAPLFRINLMTKNIPQNLARSLALLLASVSALSLPSFSQQEGEAIGSTSSSSITSTSSTSSTSTSSTSSTSTGSSANPETKGSAQELLKLPSSAPTTPSTNAGTEILRSSKDYNIGDGTVTIKRKFVPKFKERIRNLGEQIQMAQGKGFIGSQEANAFMDRQAKLLIQEQEAAKKEFQKEDMDKLETDITVLNGDLFKAMRKSDPVKPGAAETEVNDPNLIPAYPDPELQPGSGVKP